MYLFRSNCAPDYLSWKQFSIGIVNSTYLLIDNRAQFEYLFNVFLNPTLPELIPNDKRKIICLKNKSICYKKEKLGYVSS